jgi:hypothetical protein
MTNLQIPLTSSPTSPISYAVLVAGAAYNGAINVVIVDNVSVTVYTGTAQTYSTSILSSRFPISITVTPASNYQTQTISNISNAADVQITLQLITTPIKFSITANSSAYTGSLSVVLTDSAQNVVYSGNLTTWSSTEPTMYFPLSITVTPNATYQVFTQTGITSMTNLAINLLNSPVSPVKYQILAAGVAYTGFVNVVITDVAQTIVYNGSALSYSATILQSRFPLNVVVTPAANY